MNTKTSAAKSVSIESLNSLASKTQSQDVANSARFSPFGADIGNGATKVVSSMGETLTESYIHYVNPVDLSDLSSVVEYISGTREDLVSKAWLGGDIAMLFAPKHAYRITDEPTGKVDFGLQMFLSALAAQPYRPEWNIFLTLSIHDYKIYGTLMRKALEGSHIIKMNGKPSTVAITVHRVVNEGVGAAIALHQDNDFKSAVMIDVGNGTSIGRVFNGLKESFQIVNPNGGVESLIQAISQHEDMRRATHLTAQPRIIRKSIENGSFVYGNAGFNFRLIYNACVKSWVVDSIRPLLKEMSAYTADASFRFVVGGGTALPGVSEALAKKGFVCPADARFLNARGLYTASVRGCHNAA